MNSTKENLTTREQEIYRYLLSGDNYYTIADELCVERSTIFTHAMNIYSKMFVSSRLELMAKRIKELEKEVQELKQAKCITRAS